MNAAPVIAVAFELESVTVRTLVSLVPIDAGEKLFAIDGAPLTVSDALALAVFAPALAVASAPTAIVSLYVPGVELVTLTVTVHEPLAGIVPPESAALAPPFAAVTAPPAHVVAPDAGVALTTLAG